MPVMSVANSSPRPSRWNDSDRPSDGAHGNSTSRARSEPARHSSLPRKAASTAGQAASIPARCGNRLTSHAAGITITKGERIRKASTYGDATVFVHKAKRAHGTQAFARMRAHVRTRDDSINVLFVLSASQARQLQ